MKKAFTLLELIIVIIIIGILATMGFSQYAKVVENGRTAEARMILGQLRSAQIAYYQEHGVYGSITDLGIDVPVNDVCEPTHYFWYNILSNGTCYATRCLHGGKTPNVTRKYGIGLYINGTFMPILYAGEQP